MMNLYKLFPLLLTFLIFSCNEQQNETVSDMSIAEPMMSRSVDEAAVAENIVLTERKLVKNGSVEFETDNKYSGRISNTIVIRVPSSNFDSFLNDATKGVTRFDTKNIDVSDVTEEFVDHQARLKTKKELESRYLEILQRAKTVTEMLEVEKQLGELRSEIESVEGRLKYLQSQVSLSTLSITFYQNIGNDNAFGSKFKEGFANGWDNLIWFFVFLINIWPFVIVGIILFFGIRRWTKRKRKL